MDTVIFRGRRNDRWESDQWTLARDGEDAEDFVIQGHIELDAILAGKHCALLIRRMTVKAFFEAGRNPAVKAKPQSLLVARDHDLTLAAMNNSN
jgi:hypothetical protein